MRLISVQTLTLKEFAAEEDIPPYAILSHTWEHDEVSFQEFSVVEYSIKCGYEKIVGACRQAIKDGLEWLWADT
jgi:hypothetical protein